LRVGFPIRKSSDQSLFAAPQGLSQRTTSFIASQRQGIHQIPLLHLITLIIDAHTFIRTCSHRRIIRKTSYIHEFCSTIPSSHDDTHRSVSPCGDRASDRTNLLFTMSNQHAARRSIVILEGETFYTDEPVIKPRPHIFEKWWSQTGSNRRPHACKARALPTELWPHVS